MGKLALVVLITAVVAISACSQKEVKITDNDGLTINSFSIDPAQLDAKRPFRLFLEVENTGGTTARNINAQLFGMSWLDDEIKKDINPLSPPDIRRNVPGAVNVVTWSENQDDFKAPPLTAGIQQTYTITARVTYDYKTSSVINIPVYNEEEQTRRMQRGEAFNAVTNSNTQAPIKIDISGPDYVLVRDKDFEAEDAEESFYRVYVRNVGSGVPITDGETGKVKLRITAQGGLAGATCSGDEAIEISPNTEVQMDITIREGREALIPCTLRYSRNTWDTIPQGTTSLIFDASYTYFIEDSLEMTVFGRGEGQSGSGSQGTTGIDASGQTFTTLPR